MKAYFQAYRLTFSRALQRLALLVLVLAPIGAEAAEIFLLELKSSDKNIFVIDGPIERNDFYKFTKYISETRRQEYEIEIYFNSVGGDPDEAMKFGYHLKERGIKTFVLPRGRCESACSLAFFGGFEKAGFGESVGKPNRMKPHGSTLGIHFYSYTTEPGRCYSFDAVRKMENAYQDMFNKLLTYFIDVKVDLSILKKMAGTSRDHLYYIDSEEAILYDIKADALIESWVISIRDAYLRKKFPSSYRTSK